MKNKAIDLHNALFQQLERLNDLDDKEMETGKLEAEIKRADAMNKVATQLISNGRLVLEAVKVAADLPQGVEMPEMLVEKATVKALQAPPANGGGLRR